VSKTTIGVIGLGIMGSAMAQELIRRGHAVVGFDIDRGCMQKLKAMGGKPLASAQAVALDAGALITSLATSAALAATVDAIAGAKWPAGRKPPLLIETSTLPLEDKARTQDVLKVIGMEVLDCPISGTARRMEERAWTIYCSGSKAGYKQAKPILETFTDSVPYVGGFGNGTRMKFAANHLVAIYNVACAESITLARKMGLDPADVLALFAPSPVLGTGVMRMRMPFMVDRQYLPATMKVEVWQKDMQVIGDMAKSVDCPTPLFTACVPIYTAAMAQGLALEDTASVSEVLGAMAGLPARKSAAPAKGKAKAKR
jgi:putative dehydrogenase